MTEGDLKMATCLHCTQDKECRVFDTLRGGEYTVDAIAAFRFTLWGKLAER